MMKGTSLDFIAFRPGDQTMGWNNDPIIPDDNAILIDLRTFK
jgi:hypothetical protein